MDGDPRKSPQNSSLPPTQEAQRSCDDELRKCCMEAVQRMARWLDEMEAERARHPALPPRTSATHDPFYWG